MKCAAPDCEKPVYCKGHCKNHYYALKRNGDYFPRKDRGGIRKHFMYGAWAGMVNRCHNPNNASYAGYGGAGITVCDRWRNGEGHITGFELFLADMGERPEGKTLDRIDPTKGYAPENCRWATAQEQRANLSEDGERRGRVTIGERKASYWKRVRGDTDTEFGKLVRAHVAARGMSLSELARRYGYRAPSSVTNMVTGKKNVTPRFLAALEADGFSPDHLRKGAEVLDFGASLKVVK